MLLFEKRLNELKKRIESTSVVQNFNENGKIFIEALTQSFPQANWIKMSLKNAQEEFELTWNEQKENWKRSQQRMKKERDGTPESK